MIWWTLHVFCYLIFEALKILAHTQGSKLKKSSGRLLATNWRNIVARCKFLVASLYMTQLIVRASDISRRQNTQNTAKFGRNLSKYMSVQRIWKFSQLMGLFTCRNLVKISRNFVTETCKQRPETPKLQGVDYVAKNWALAMMLKALPLVQFWKSKWWPLLEKH